MAFCDLDSLPGSEMSDTLARTMSEALKASLKQSYGIEVIEPFHSWHVVIAEQLFPAER